jgi:hypothetical protein
VQDSMRGVAQPGLAYHLCWVLQGKHSYLTVVSCKYTLLPVLDACSNQCMPCCQHSRILSTRQHQNPADHPSLS